MRRNFTIPPLSILALLLTNGCATIVHGTKQPVAFTTNPPGAEILVDGESVGHAPVTVPIKHKDDKIVEARLPGYQTAAGRLTTSFSGYTLLGSLPGMLVDAATGAMLSLDQASLHLELRPIAPVAGSGWGGAAAANEPASTQGTAAIPASPAPSAPVAITTRPRIFVPREELENVGSGYRVLGKALLWGGLLTGSAGFLGYSADEPKSTTRARFEIEGAAFAAIVGGLALDVYSNALRWNAFTDAGYASNRTMTSAWTWTVIGGAFGAGGLAMVAAGAAQKKDGPVVGGAILAMVGSFPVMIASGLSSRIKYLKPGEPLAGLSVQPWVAPVAALSQPSGLAQSGVAAGLAGRF